jgi:hypothetical protein
MTIGRASTRGPCPGTTGPEADRTPCPARLDPFKILAASSEEMLVSQLAELVLAFSSGS